MSYFPFKKLRLFGPRLFKNVRLIRSELFKKVRLLVSLLISYYLVFFKGQKY